MQTVVDRAEADSDNNGNKILKHLTYINPGV